MPKHGVTTMPTHGVIMTTHGVTLLCSYYYYYYYVHLVVLARVGDVAVRGVERAVSPRGGLAHGHVAVPALQAHREPERADPREVVPEVWPVERAVLVVLVGRGGPHGRVRHEVKLALWGRRGGARLVLVCGGVRGRCGGARRRVEVRGGARGGALTGRTRPKTSVSEV